MVNSKTNGNVKRMAGLAFRESVSLLVDVLTKHRAEILTHQMLGMFRHWEVAVDESFQRQVSGGI